MSFRLENMYEYEDTVTHIYSERITPKSVRTKASIRGIGQGNAIYIYQRIAR